MPPTRRAPASSPDARNAAAVLVLGPEDFLADREVAALVARAREADPATERRDVDLGSERAAGDLAAALSPNLFGDAAVVVCRGAESADPAVVEVLLDAARSGPGQGATLVVVHPGGVKGRGVADKLKKGGFAVLACEKPKGRAFEEFVAREFAAHGRRPAGDAVSALRAAVGDDLRLLAAAVAQLAADVEGTEIDAEDVATYYEGVADVPGYLISDAVWDGRAAEVVRRTRWALVNDPGIGPAITSAVAGGLRSLARYGSAPRGMAEGQLAAHVGAPPWKLRALREQTGRWHPATLARAFGALAVADAAVKGRDARGKVLQEAGLDREQSSYLLERTLLRIAGATRTGRR